MRESGEVSRVMWGLGLVNRERSPVRSESTVWFSFLRLNTQRGGESVTRQSVGWLVSGTGNRCLLSWFSEGLQGTKSGTLRS